ncbi:High affinity cAMP-specific 3',5'-cyclic phosphodiesterase 7A [Borealophlyctis nickersoniae]|nr:High affinity cAMP-specific 3',5'-cyclic phosphodiesterase 7A [Borealophlyctis nickersoniae]
MNDVEAMLETATTYHFNIFEFARITEGRPLYFLGYHLLEYYGLIEHFQLDEFKVRAFFEQIERAYHPLPYHNSIHGADVLQTVNLLLLSDEKMAVNFTKLEIFAACVASAVHDVDHPGLNNNFLVQTSHPLAIFYNDISVLEYHHAAKAFEIAGNPDTGIFSGLPTDVYREARKLIINMVVATDMAQHFQYINKLKGKIAASALKLEEAGDRALLLEMAIKCGDLNNPVKPQEQSVKWAMRVMDEFFKQGDRERKMGMPVSKFMDRYDTNIPKCQIGFMDILVVPLFGAWSECVHTEFTNFCMENIAVNRAYWQAMLDDPDSQAKFVMAADEGFEDVNIDVPPPFTFRLNHAMSNAMQRRQSTVTEEEVGEGGEDDDTVSPSPRHPRQLSNGPPTPADVSLRQRSANLAVTGTLRPVRVASPRGSISSPSSSSTSQRIPSPSRPTSSTPPPRLPKSPSGGELSLPAGPEHLNQRRASASASMMSSFTFSERNGLNGVAGGTSAGTPTTPTSISAPSSIHPPPLKDYNRHKNPLPALTHTSSSLQMYSKELDAAASAGSLGSEELVRVGRKVSSAFVAQPPAEQMEGRPRSGFRSRSKSQGDPKKSSMSEVKVQRATASPKPAQ